MEVEDQAFFRCDALVARAQKSGYTLDICDFTDDGEPDLSKGILAFFKSRLLACDGYERSGGSAEVLAVQIGALLL